MAILLSQRDFSVIAAWAVGLGLAGLAAAIGILTMVPALRSGPAPAAPSQRIVVVGCVASALILGPDLVHRIVPDPIPVAITGLAVLAAAIALAARLGRRPGLGAEPGSRGCLRGWVRAGSAALAAARRFGLRADSRAVTAAATIGAGAMLPVALGLIVPAIGLGLTEADTLVNQGALAGAGGGAQLLVTGPISGLALLAGAGRSWRRTGRSREPTRRVNPGNRNQCREKRLLG